MSILNLIAQGGAQPDFAGPIKEERNRREVLKQQDIENQRATRQEERQGRLDEEAMRNNELSRELTTVQIESARIKNRGTREDARFDAVAEFTNATSHLLDDAVKTGNYEPLENAYINRLNDLQAQIDGGDKSIDLTETLEGIDRIQKGQFDQLRQEYDVINKISDFRRSEKLSGKDNRTAGQKNYSQLQSLRQDLRVAETQEEKEDILRKINDFHGVTKTLPKGTEETLGGGIENIKGYANSLVEKHYAESSGDLLAKLDYKPKIAQALAQIEIDNAAEIERQKKIGKGEISDVEKRDVSKKHLQSMINGLRDDFIGLGDLGEIIDVDEGKVSNLIRAGKSSAAGQYLDTITGDRAQVLRDGIDMAKPQLLLKLMSASDASARALDSDNELKIWLNTTGDTKRSLQSNLNMLERIETIAGTGSSGTGDKNTGVSISFEDFMNE